MATFSKTILLFLGLFLPFIPLASAEKPIVNIAAAYTSEANDGWARYLYWQQPNNNTIVIRRRDPDAKTVEIRGAILPRENSPLAAHYIKSRKFPGADDVRLFTLRPSKDLN